MAATFGTAVIGLTHPTPVQCGSDLVGRTADTITAIGKASAGAFIMITAGTASVSETATAGATMKIANTNENETASTTIANVILKIQNAGVAYPRTCA